MTIEERNKYIEDAWHRINKYIHREVGKMLPGGASFYVNTGNSVSRCNIVIIANGDQRDVVLLHDYIVNSFDAHFVYTKDDTYACKYNFYKLESLESIAKRELESPIDEKRIDKEDMRKKAIISLIRDWSCVKRSIHDAIDFEKSLIDFRP